jgi:lipopolysaccharide transport system ATP-binding protein
LTQCSFGEYVLLRRQALTPRSRLCAPRSPLAFELPTQCSLQTHSPWRAPSSQLRWSCGLVVSSDVMSDNPIIRVEGLGKRYSLRHLRDQRYIALRDVLVEKATGLFRRNGKAPQADSAHEDFWALKDVSFEVKEGEVVGIIGRNGAGKSTLLKILSRITEPTEGRVRIKGRVASLLEVGTGFHPELTGRENIFLNGAVLGMTRAEIKKKFDEIVAFAETEKFLDTPVKRYSSGMYMRLAFAVAAHLEPEILVIDEVLAVGDVAFQQKCLGKMQQVGKSGRTILFVSHNMQSIRDLCHRAILLEGGHKSKEGNPEEVISQYLEQGRQTTESILDVNRLLNDLPLDQVFRMREVDVSQDGRSTTELLSGKPVQITLRYDVLEAANDLHVYVLLCDFDGTLIFESLHNGDFEATPFMARGSYVSTVTIPPDFLAGRTYELQIQAAIRRVRNFFPTPLSVPLHVHSAGKVNRAYPGYNTPGKIAPLLDWETSRLAD